ncbi:MAG: T9SS type A sorting domain-containing protein [Schleiferiaceae bacterium]|jgi:hypothetical protein|nr:T9SS type A sorting domain-containing protein [Schleiferiaceae bacterium]
MNKRILTLLAFVCSLSLWAQKDVYFKIDHTLAGNPFSYNTATSNNLGNTFSVTRLEYYISQIILIHDGGQKTPVANTWILVDATIPVNENLGNFNISNLEAVQFAVGVEQSVNHSDPSAYPTGHPLAPQFPSMHWGWSAGYRFVAYEGKGGASLNQTFQIHALGDGNYFPMTIATAGTPSGGDLNIDLTADYTRGLDNIDVSNGLFNHGETDEAEDVLINFTRHVFLAADGANSVSLEEQEKPEFKLYPNPSSGLAFLEVNDLKGFSLSVTNMVGQEVLHINEISNNKVQLDLETSGIYFVSLIDAQGSAVSTQKLIVSK